MAELASKDRPEIAAPDQHGVTVLGLRCHFMIFRTRFAGTTFLLRF